MKPHRAVMRLKSTALNVAGVKGVSTTKAGVPPTVAAWDVEPHANMPVIWASRATVEASQTFPVAGALPINLMTTELGMAGVKVLLIRSFFTESETNPFGVTRQLQQEISCSSGENVYTFTQRLLLLAPEFDRLT